MARQETNNTVKATHMINDAANAELKLRAGDVVGLKNAYLKEKKVPIYLSPMYRPYFGNVMNVDINGVSIFVPVDGSTHNVPQTFADEIVRRRMSIDTLLTRQDRMANVSDNAEKAPGELKLF